MTQSSPARRKIVVVYRGQLLPFSETFIRSQILALKRWRAILMGETYLTSGLSLAGVESGLILPATGRWHRAAFHMFRYAGLAYPPVIRELRRVGADLIHAHFGTSAVEIWPYARSLGLPMLVTLHGYDITVDRLWWQAGHGGKHMRSYPANLLALVKEPAVRFLAVSEAIREEALRFGIPDDRIAVSYVGVDPCGFAPGPTPLAARKYRVLYVGRFVEKKGVCYLIEAIGRLASEIPGLELILVGDGPLRDSLRAQCTLLGVRAEFKGALSSDEVRREMDGARALCLPSITASNGDAEGLGLVLLEAQAAGLPVLTSARGGATEAVLHEVSGFRFPEKDVSTLTMQLRQLLSNDRLLESMSEAAVENVARRFDIRDRIKTVEDQYDKLLKETA